MSLFTKLSAFVKATLIYFRSLVLYQFGARGRKAVLDAVQDVEKQVVTEVYEKASEVLGNDMGVFDVTPPPPHADIATPESSTTQMGPVLPLSDVTNVPRTPPRRSVSKRNDENFSPTRSQTPRKPTPLRRMPRYLNLMGSAPLKPSQVKVSPKSTKSSRVSMASFSLDGSPKGFKTSTSSISPLCLEAGLANTSSKSLNLGARIRSAIYGRKADEGDDDESLAARDLFNRDSVCSGFALDGVLKLIKDLDEQDYGKPIRMESTCYSPSKGSPSSLPYLRDRSPSFASSMISSSSGAFNDFLASVERKYPGTAWNEIVHFCDSTESVTEDLHWSDVVSLDEYMD